MTKMEKEAITKERNNDGEKNQFLKSFDEIFKSFFKILDFNELDANRFLSIKDSKKYRLFIKKRLLIVILFYISMWCTLIIDVLLPSFIPYGVISSLIILFVIGLPLIYIGVRNEMSFAEKGNYNKSFYRKEKKEMNKYCKQLNLIIYNRYVIEELGERNYTNNYKNKIKRINNRVDYYSKLFKPLNHYFIHFGLISLVTSVSTIIFELVYSSIQNINISIEVIYLSLFLPMISLSTSLTLYLLMISSATESLYDEKIFLTNAKSSLSGELKKATEILQELVFGKS